MPFQHYREVKWFKKDVPKIYLNRKFFILWEHLQQYTELNMELDAFDNIKDMLIRKYKGHGTAAEVDSILRAEGFVTYLNPEGHDKGVDILAAQGALGFDSPKPSAQVKTTGFPIDRSTLDQLIGTMSNFKADFGLLVFWGGFKN